MKTRIQAQDPHASDHHFGFSVAPAVQNARDRLIKYIKFCIVGGSGVVVDMALLWMLASPTMFDWNLSVSKIIAAEAALVNNFIWNDVWTFRAINITLTWQGTLIRFAKFNLICTAGIVLSVLLLNLQVRQLRFDPYIANFVAIVLVSLWNFFLNLKFGWNK